MLELTKDNLDETLKSNPLLVVDFWATWCPPCRAMAPMFDKLGAKHTDFLFAKVDVDAQPEIAEKYQVSSIPTFLFFKNGELVTQAIGVIPEAKFELALQQTRNS